MNGAIGVVVIHPWEDETGMREMGISLDDGGRPWLI